MWMNAIPSAALLIAGVAGDGTGAGLARGQLFKIGVGGAALWLCGLPTGVGPTGRLYSLTFRAGAAFGGNGAGSAANGCCRRYSSQGGGRVFDRLQMIVNRLGAFDLAWQPGIPFYWHGCRKAGEYTLPDGEGKACWCERRINMQ